MSITGGIGTGLNNTEIGVSIGGEGGTGGTADKVKVDSKGHVSTEAISHPASWPKASVGAAAMAA